ncbi:MAG: hypothetical protein ACR2PX_25025 [Endozoicomonas sp.]|uniref:hypothetical protein n=1 Tax=Endozoicomonas sp. TaxID=1892382 RepID=UPI003D9B050C
MRDLIRIACQMIAVLIFLQSSVNADDTDSTQMDLGMGYSSDEGRVLGASCLKPGKISHIGSAVGTVHFGRQVSSSDVQLNLGVNLDGSVSYDVFTGSAKVKYALETGEDKRVETYTFVETVVSGASSMSTAGVAEEALNELWGSQPIPKGQSSFVPRAVTGLWNQPIPGAACWFLFGAILTVSTKSTILKKNPPSSMPPSVI